MDKVTKRRVYWLVALTIGMAIIPPVIFGATPMKPDRQGGDPWRNTIEDFQTLLAGIFAVGAAYITVRQMQKSDMKSDTRHDELVRLGLRSDRLIVERMLYPQFGQLRESYRALRHYEINLYQRANEPDFIDHLKRESSAFLDLTITTHNVVFSPNWQSAKHLFGGTLSHDEAILTHLCNEMWEQASLVVNTLNMGSTEVNRWVEGKMVPVPIDQIVVESRQHVLKVRKAMEPVFKALYELADTYRIES